MQFKDYAKIERWYVASGFSVFIGTIVLGVILSIVYKPILIARYLIPSASVLWLVILIISNKLEDKRLFLISLALIMVLCISGLGNVIMTEDTLTDKGKYNMKAFDEINSNNDSIVIFSTPTSMNHFESFISPHQKFYVAKFDGLMESAMISCMTRLNLMNCPVKRSVMF